MDNRECFENYRNVLGENFEYAYFYFQQFIDIHNFLSLNYRQLKEYEKILIYKLWIVCKEAAILRIAKFIDPHSKAASLHRYLDTARKVASDFKNATCVEVEEMVKNDKKLIKSKSKITRKVKIWRDKRVAHQEGDPSYLADPEKVYFDESEEIGVLRELLIMCKDIINRYSTHFDGKTVAFIFEKENLHGFLRLMGKCNPKFNLPDNRLCGYVRSLSKRDSTGWLERELLIMQNDAGFPEVATSLRLFDENGVEYPMKTTKGANRKGYVIIGQASRLRPWYKEHFDDNRVDPNEDKVVLFPLSDDFMTDRRFYIFTEDEYRTFIYRGQSIDLERNVWS